MIEPRYRNLSTLGIIAPLMATSLATPPSSALNLQCKYYVFDLLSLKPLASKVSLQSSNLLFTPSLDSSIRTIPSANRLRNKRVLNYVNGNIYTRTTY